MYLTRTELLEIHSALKTGKLHRKIGLALYPNEETIEAIKKEFPDAEEIWKDDASNSYIARFKDEEEYESFEECRLWRANHLYVQQNKDVEIQTMEIPEEDWMYSGYELVWKKGD